MQHETPPRLSKQRPSIRELLADPESEDIEFEPPRVGNEVPSVPSCLRAFVVKQQQSDMTQTLEGIRVIDFTHDQAGPVCHLRLHL